MIAYLQGKKTYIIGICGILYAAFGYFSGHIDITTAAQFVVGSLAAMGIRNGITTEIQALASKNSTTSA